MSPKTKSKQNSTPKTDWYKLPLQEVFLKLTSSPKGISSKDATNRLDEFGTNELEEGSKENWVHILLSQFNSPIVWILIGAVIISLLVSEVVDAVVIAIILLLNTVLGFVQEFKAEKSIEALKKMSSLRATVFRDGHHVKIDAKELVPGDILILETGEKVPADCRLIEAVDLNIEEAALTGESVPVTKKIFVIDKEVTIGDRKNMIFSGTVITNGRGKAIVCETGMRTEIGHIAHLIQHAEKNLTPLQLKLQKLGKTLGILVVVIAIITFITGFLKGEGAVEMLLAAISLAVAAIPEGLPAVVTIALALGVQRMLKRNALMRHLPSVETLGATTVICSDKTGTLTHNQMTVKKIFYDDREISVSGDGYQPEGEFSIASEKLKLILKIGAQNNDAKLNREKWECMGDPTEGCLLTAALKAGLDYSELNKKYPRVDEVGFSSERKRMTTVHKTDNGKVVYVKGAVDVILDNCEYIWIGEKRQRITREMKKKLLLKNDEFSSQALRVLGFAFKEITDNTKKEDYEKDLVFVGMQCMIDPPRKEVKESIAKCRTAGIKVVMITGDYLKTAVAIGKALGIEGKAIMGSELNDMSSEELLKQVDEISIYARVNPEHKLQIVEALQKKGHIVAMTGDGVNDAPALKKADIGIAMGISGTDVAKEASEMILLDDNFTSIVSAVEEGRNIFDNIRKFVEYLLSCNLGEVLTIFVAILLGLPLPLIALQILWVNLTTDGLPALALGVDPPSPDIMKRKPRKVESGIIDKPRAVFMVFVGLIMMVGTLALFTYYNFKYGMDYARTVAFCALMMFQMWNVFNSKAEESSLFKVGIFSNMKLIYAVVISIVLQLVVIYTPLSALFKTVSLGVFDWVIIVGVTSSVFIFGELIKFIWKLSGRSEV
ncbi:calcium-transporting P-type ATPase, PMR1-type [Candidatus Woesearchaeota archaeon]|jgi:P-type Ca2+ transporter type 2C|nr:calcium-transporting P-type ATPase, PMR1-type [Candidatus Woesearchaeota archaeon]